MLPEIASTTSARLGFGIAVEQPLRGEDHAGGAEAALHREAVREGALQRMQLAAVGEPLQRLDRAALDALRRDQAGELKLAVDQHRAGAAGALPAAVLRRGQPELVAEHVDEERAGLDELRLLLRR